MDSELLVDQKDDGRALVEQLSRDGLEVAAAFWALEHGRTAWRLYIASPRFDEQDMRAVHRLVLPSLDKVPSKWASLIDLQLLNSENPVVKAAVEIRDRDRSGMAAAYDGARLGDMKIHGAYIYPEIAPARLLFTVRYTRVDEADRWNAELRYEDSHAGLRPKGAVSYTIAKGNGDHSNDVRVAHVGVLVEIDPKFVPFSPRDQTDLLTLASQQARVAADAMFKTHHPAAVVEAADDHCLVP